jgi:hypothetical protein
LNAQAQFPAARLPMVFLHVGVGHRGSWRCRPSWTGRCLAVCPTAAFVDGRGSRPAAGRTPLAGAGVPAASGSRSCRRRGCRARRWRPASWMVATSTSSSSAHRCSGAAIGRPRSGSCQVPTEAAYRTHVREGIGNATDCNRTGRRGTEAIGAACGPDGQPGCVGQQIGSNRPP